MGSERRKRMREQARTGPGTDTPVKTMKFFPAADLDRQRQDFLAGTVFAAGAGVMFPIVPSDPAAPDEPAPAPLFVIFVNDDDSTWHPAPVLVDLFALHDQLGAMELHNRTYGGISWAILDGPAPLAKLKIDIREPVAGTAEIVLLADQYAEHWHHIAAGGLLGITTQQRAEQAATRPGATLEDGFLACILIQTSGSPGIRHLIDSHRWPTS